MSKILAFLSMGVIIMTAVSCTSLQKDQPTELQYADSGNTVKTSVGEKINIALDANATTGYTWQVVNYGKRVIKLDESAYKTDSKLIGAGGEQVYSFSAVGQGMTELIIKYSRPWEKDVPAAKKFVLNIVVE